MNRLILRSTLRIHSPGVSNQICQRFLQNENDRSKSFEEYAQHRIQDEKPISFYRKLFGPSKQALPNANSISIGVWERAKRVLNPALAFKPDYSKLDRELQTLLDTAGAQLYYDCANSYPYLALLKEFDLPDYMSSWYKLTLLHVWMSLMRLHLALDDVAYMRIKHSMLSTLWFDVDKRLEIIGEEINQRLNSKTDLKKMHGLYVQTLFEYDEGFLDTDCMLAAAVWRNLYMSRFVDPVYLNNTVRYIRTTVAYLDTIDSNSLVTTGIKKWIPAEQLANSI